MQPQRMAFRPWRVFFGLTLLLSSFAAYAQVAFVNYQVVSGTASGYYKPTYVGTFNETANSQDTVCLALNLNSAPTADFEPRIQIYAPNGNVANNTSYNTSGAHGCFRSWAYTGTYTVAVFNIVNTTASANFYLQFTRPGDAYNTGTLGGGQFYPGGGTFSGSLPQFFSQLWTLPVNAGDKVTVAANSITGEIPYYLDLQLQLYDPRGVFVTSSYSDPAGISFAPTIPGNYTVVATQYSGSQPLANPMTYNLTATGSTAIPLEFVPVTPCRIADTRNTPGAFGGPLLAAGTTRTFEIPQSACNIPDTAAAYSLNVTAVPSGPLGHLTLWAAGQPQPQVSTLNSDGRNKANAAIVPAGTGGGVNIFVTDASHVVLDIDGYFVTKNTAPALAFYPTTPCRVVDTRNATGPLGAPSMPGNTTRSFPIQSSSCNLPSNAMAYSLNVTAVPTGPLGHLTMWASGESQPLVSTLNAPTGTTTANAAIVPAGSAGAVSVYVSDPADVVMDVNGYFAAPAANGLSLYTNPPCRVIDTRSSSGPFVGALVVPVAGSTCAAPSVAEAYVLNATVVPTGSLGYLTLWPDGQTQPLASTLNAEDGVIASNMAIVPTTNGKIDADALNNTQLILDLPAYFAP